MPNKSANSKNSKIKGALQTSLATMLTSAIGLTSGVSFTALNQGQQVSAYLRDSIPEEQQRLLMTTDNYLTTEKNFWMNVLLTANNNFPITYNVSLNFTIPNYDLSNLVFVINDRSGANVGEYKITNESPVIELNNLTQSNYIVNVFEGSSSGNFVCKGEFAVVNRYGFTDTVETNILDSSGNPVVINGTTQKLSYYKPNTATGDYVVGLNLPYNLIPYNAHTVKVAFFETEADRGGEPVNISQSLYDYVYGLHFVNEGGFYFYCRLKTAASSGKTYEAHFYRDEVKEGNFICKAVGITF